MLLNLLVYVVVLGLLYWLIMQLPLPSPFDVAVKVIFIIIVILMLVSAVDGVPGIRLPRLG